MPNYLTIDTGTTNTRIALVANNTIVDIAKFPVGAKKGIDDKTLLVQTIKQGIASILAKNHMEENQIERILASGMITSALGLLDLIIDTQITTNANRGLRAFINNLLGG